MGGCLIAGQKVEFDVSLHPEKNNQRPSRLNVIQFMSLRESHRKPQTLNPKPKCGMSD